MAGIKAPIQDILTRLSTLTPLNQDNLTPPLYARMWNNQLKDQAEGKTYSFPFPCSFLELINPTNYNRLGNGIDESDVVWRIHLAHEQLDAMDGTFEQDLTIFDLRDSIVALLSGFKPTGCGSMVRIHEEQDYNHDNIYHYMIDFICGFIDSKGSPFDTGRTDYRDSIPPQILNQVVTTSEGNDDKTRKQPYIIPQN